MVFLGVLFLDHYFLLLIALRSAQLFKLATWNTSDMQIIQIYISLATPDTNCSFNQLWDCLYDILICFLLLVHRSSVANLIVYPIPMLSQNFTPAVSARKLRVTVVNNIFFRQPISQTCRCCFYHIRDHRRICRYISFPIAKTTANTIISSRFDYCNSLFHNIA